MKSVNLKKVLPYAVFFFAMATLTSCNRGIGCPSDFSISKTVVKTVVQVPVAAAKAIID